MKCLFFFTIPVCIFFSCTSKKETSNADVSAVVADTADNFFPVTSFIKGEIYQIKNGGTTPVRKITISNKTDSTWVKMEILDSLTAAFTAPLIDTANCKTTFEEKKFLDQTINAYTFTYEPKVGVNNTFAFAKWDVYVHPESQKVTRIYLVKNEPPNKIVQLTWQAGKWCKIVTLNKTVDHKLVKEKEETITWRFD